MRYNASFPAVDDSGRLTDAFRTFLLESDPLTGTGSPEGVVSARQFRFYIDATGVSGSILYVKRDPDVGGDRSQGWIAV